MSAASSKFPSHLPSSVTERERSADIFIADNEVDGFGGLTPIDERRTGSGTAQRPYRHHRFFTLQLDGYEHAVEITDPVNSTPEYLIASSPGFTEHIRGGIRRKMHSHTAYAHPHARLVSVESNGIGSIGDRYSWQNRNTHGMDAMGQQRQKIARILGGKLPVFMHGTSIDRKSVV